MEVVLAIHCYHKLDPSEDIVNLDVETPVCVKTSVLLLSGPPRC